MNWFIVVVLVIYVAVMYAISLFARTRVHETEDFLVAGRSLPLSLAWATLLATWFGAGTLLTAADEIRQGGIERMALEPLGSGVCLLIAGFFFARPLWRMGLFTLGDFFARRFGTRAEVTASLIMVPSYFGWIAVQFLALAGILELVCGLDMTIGLLLVAAVSTGYTWLGGMWSVVLTDAVQVGLMLIGLVILAVGVFGTLGDDAGLAGGMNRLIAESPEGFLRPIPLESASAIFGWLNVFMIAALGNIPAQDLMQRVFSSKSEKVAQRACWMAGTAYLVFGMIPVLLGAASRILLPDISESIVPALAQLVLNPFLFLVFILTLVSAVLSTIDSAILAPSTTLALNLLPKVLGDRIPVLRLTRLSILGVAAVSLLFALLGSSAYRLLEDAYTLPLVGLLVPLTFGLYRGAAREMTAVLSMVVGVGLWLVHFLAGWEHFLEPLLSPWLDLPVPVTATVAALLAYLTAERLAELTRTSEQVGEEAG